MPLVKDLFNNDFLTDMAVLPAIALLVAISGSLIWLIARRCFYKRRSAQDNTAAFPDAETRPAWHTLSAEEALHELASDHAAGLSQTDAADRLHRYGLNRLTEKPPRPAWHLLLSQFKSFLILVLIAAAILAAAIGDLKDGVVILVVVIINDLLGFYQEFQAEKSLAALKKMLALLAEVRRDGRNIELPADQLVPGDIVILEAGSKIPADGRIITAHTLEVDESSLTGESVPVAKQKQELTMASLPLAERSNMLYMNNAVTRGRAEMVVTATGMETEIGKLGQRAHLRKNLRFQQNDFVRTLNESVL